MSAISYRPEIDGLRAVAVVPVILFHAGIAQFSGGYVGVDVFFVISGYLISSIILREMAEGQFSILRFWERRARRILPALALVVFCTIPFAWMWMLPEAFERFARSLVAVSLFSSNILFWKESGYFAAAAEIKPLLHTWSLAVEEQYYIIFPLFLLLVWRTGREGRLFWIILTIAMVSLLLSEVAWRVRDAANFFLLPTRAWELLAGALCTILQRRHGPWRSSWLGLLGLGMILAAVLSFDASTPVPSVWALLPVGGTALVILFATQDSGPARVLRWRPLLGIGLVSYSAYLWHQPIFALARTRSLDPPSEWQMVGLALLSLGLATLSWRFVEQPFRLGSNPWLPRRRQVFGAAIATGAVVIAIGVFGVATQGAAFRVAMPDSLRASLYHRAYEDTCFNKTPEDKGAADGWFCFPAGVAAPADARRIAVIGDSHALSFLPALISELGAHGYTVAFSGVAGCPPLVDTFIYRTDDYRAVCNDRNAEIFKELKAARVDGVVLIARWAMYAYGDLPQSQRFVDTQYDVRRDLAHSRAVFDTQMAATLDDLQAQGLPVWILHQAPLQNYEAPDVYGRFLLQHEGEDFLRRHSVRRAAWEALYAPTRDDLEAAAANRPLVHTLDPVGYVCDGGVCPVGTPEVADYIDRHHVSNPGAAPAAAVLANQIVKQLAAGRTTADGAGE